MTRLTSLAPAPHRLGYLSAAPTVSTRPDAASAGPRAHILGVVNGFRGLGWEVHPWIAGDRLPPPEEPPPQRLADACARLDRMLGDAARRRGLAGWLEKTPEHAFFTGEIRRFMPGARFVHILRDGPDVVASLWDARQRYPDSWGWLRGLDDMIRLYNRYARVARRER